MSMFTTQAVYFKCSGLCCYCYSFMSFTASQLNVDLSRILVEGIVIDCKCTHFFNMSTTYPYFILKYI